MKRRLLALIIYPNLLGDTNITVANASDICMRELLQVVTDQLRGPMCPRFKVDVANHRRGHKDQLNSLKDMNLYHSILTYTLSSR
jgi:hypothetical protein